MGQKRRKYNWKHYLFLGIVAPIFFLIVIIPVNIAIANLKYPQPQAILCLGGDHHREKLAAKLAQQNSDLMIWVSSGSDNKITNRIFRQAGIPHQRFFLDNRATDTVTNFTTLLADFKQYHIKHLYLITSDFHMPRARAIATIILGSRGIAFTSMEVRTKRKDPEPKMKILRDVARSIFWVFSGYTGAKLK
ncbi:MAG: YdcF family protein [Cyanobacteria bacterium P01_F01_bin.143]